MKFLAGFMGLAIAAGTMVPGRAATIRWESVALENAPPVAEAGANVAAACEVEGGATVTLDGSGSTDADSTPGTHDDIVKYAWTDDGFPIADAETAAVAFLVGVHVVTLSVTDAAGAVASDDLTVTVYDTAPPVIACPEDVKTECQASGRSEIVMPPAQSKDTCFGTAEITNDRTTGGASASGPYPLGDTTVTYTATDAAGNIAACRTVVTVADTIPPVIAVEAAPQLLWPPNHAMRAVHARVTVRDACDPSAHFVLQSVVSSEVDDAPGGGDGSTAHDVQQAAIGTPDVDVLLRAERRGGGPGRTYAIEFVAVDASGKSASGVTTVVVP